MSARLVSRLSTLEAARTVYFIVIGLAVKQSLILLGHTWPPKDYPTAPTWPFWARAIIAAGYLGTVIRFSHGVTLLYGHEKQRIEKSILPSASKISELSLFLVLLAIPLFLMADNVVETNSYIVWTAILLVADFAYVLRSGVVRHPLRRVFRLLQETDRAYAAHAAFWWMVTDAVLFIACGLFYSSYSLNFVLVPDLPVRELLFAAVLILGAVGDYWLNWDFYFGGRQDRRKQKFVFVLSPLRNADPALYKQNINRAQWYCLNLMKWRGRFGKRIAPIASHAFFPYFLNDGVREDRALGVECTVAYLSACDAVYVYVPARNRALKAFFERKTINQWCDKLGLRASLSHGFLNRFVERLDKNEISEEMRYALDTAKAHGLDIKYMKEVSPLPEPSNIWSPPDWRRITYEPKPVDKKPSQSYFKGAAQRKKVYVCTRFRGAGFAEKSWNEMTQQLQDNSKLALWHCHELLRDPDEAIAPFAPQAFYPYFWKFMHIDEVDASRNRIDLENWDAWFQRSIEILKVCDAVYIYTPEGLPANDEECSGGVLLVDRTARNLGLEIQYRKELELPEEQRIAAEGELAKAIRISQKASADAEVAHDSTRDAHQKASLAKQKAEALRKTAEEARSAAESAESLLKKRTWDPATPEF